MREQVNRRGVQGGTPQLGTRACMRPRVMCNGKGGSGGERPSYGCESSEFFEGNTHGGAGGEHPWQVGVCEGGRQLEGRVWGGTPQLGAGVCMKPRVMCLQKGGSGGERPSQGCESVNKRREGNRRV